MSVAKIFPTYFKIQATTFLVSFPPHPTETFSNIFYDIYLLSPLFLNVNLLLYVEDITKIICVRKSTYLYLNSDNTSRLLQLHLQKCVTQFY